MRVIYGNGVEGQLVHDELGRVIRIEYHKGGVLLDSCRLRYDEGGHRAVVQYLGAPHAISFIASTATNASWKSDRDFRWPRCRMSLRPRRRWPMWPRRGSPPPWLRALRLALMTRTHGPR